MAKDYNEDRKLILAELLRLSCNLDKLRDISTTMAVEIGEIRATNAVKAGFWGSIGGTICAIALTIILKGVIK